MKLDYFPINLKSGDGSSLHTCMLWRALTDLEVKWHQCQTKHLAGRSKPIWCTGLLRQLSGLRYNVNITIGWINFAIKMFSYHLENFNIQVHYILKATQLNSKKPQTIQFLKWAEDLNHIYPKKTYRQLTGTWKDAQHQLNLLEIQTKTNELSLHTSQIHFQKIIHNSISEDVEKRKLLGIAGGKLVLPSRNSMEVLEEILNRTPNDPAILLRILTQKKQNTISKRYIQPHVLCSIMHYL